jgi:flagellar biosynthesis protein FliQ
MLGAMADLEEQALRKDRRFLVRLILVLVVGTVAGLWMFTAMTSDRAMGCAADAVGGVASPPRSE